MKKNIKQKNINKTSKSHLWLWVFIAFVFGGCIGFASHYTIVNWHGFFATCPDGNRPDKYGCCVDEVYKDIGQGEFACCQGDDCFPPMK